MIRAIIFDCAGVILSEGYWDYLYKNIPNIEKKHDFYMELSKKADLDLITEKEFTEVIGKEAKKLPDTVEKELLEEFRPNVKVIELIKKLKSKYKIGLLSNFHKKWIGILFKKFDLEKYFDTVVVSSNVGFIKPNAEIYQITLDRLHIGPEEAVFIDDRQTNIEGAKKVGMHGIVYSSFEQLIKELQLLGIKA